MSLKVRSPRTATINTWRYRVHPGFGLQPADVDAGQRHAVLAALASLASPSVIFVPSNLQVHSISRRWSCQHPHRLPTQALIALVDFVRGFQSVENGVLLTVSHGHFLAGEAEHGFLELWIAAVMLIKNREWTAVLKRLGFEIGPESFPVLRASHVLFDRF